MMKTTKDDTIRELYKKWEHTKVKYGFVIEQAKEADMLCLKTQNAVVDEITKKYNAKVIKRNAEVLFAYALHFSRR